uniref:Uncharacterized protein n=1 Tax=Anguilla anguilla TaxID=7936 RepID=A0A0E9PUJ6_ANGAN
MIYCEGSKTNGRLEPRGFRQHFYDRDFHSKTFKCMEQYRPQGVSLKFWK